MTSKDLAECSGKKLEVVKSCDGDIQPTASNANEYAEADNTKKNRAYIIKIKIKYTEQVER